MLLCKHFSAMHYVIGAAPSAEVYFNLKYCFALGMIWEADVCRGRTVRTVTFVENVLSLETFLTDNYNPNHLQHYLVARGSFVQHRCYCFVAFSFFSMINVSKTIFYAPGCLFLMSYGKDVSILQQGLKLATASEPHRSKLSSSGLLLGLVYTL